jgi:nitrogen fixation/metabolism regulation signal transduction histidine kinase
VRKRENAGNGYAIFGRYANLKVLAKSGDQTSKPDQGLRWQTMPSAGHHEQPVELLEEILRGPFFILQVLAFGTSNPSLDGIFVEATKQFLRASTQIHTMETIRNASGELRMAARLEGNRSDLDAFPPMFVDVLPHVQKHVIKLARTIDQRFAVIGKRQGHKTLTGQPALNATEDKAIRQACSGRTSGHNEGFVTVHCA